jgi:lysophospholipase L1-like esterase
MNMKLVFLCAMVFFLSGFNMQNKKTIVFFGDSITEQGVRPNGYVSLVDSMLQQQSANAYNVVGAGIGGNKVYDLYLRLEDDVLAKKPAVVVIWIGVNDVWHKRLLGTGTDADKFVKFYQAIITKLQQQNIQVALCTPSTIGEKWDGTNELDGDLNKYAALIRSLAQKNNCKLIDLREAFLSYSKTNNPENKDNGILTGDGVHLNATGNRFVAQQMMDGLKALL